MSRYQLRIYDVAEGRMEAFVAAFEQVARLRQHFGFRVIGPWISEEANRFVWIAAHDGDFEAAAAAYYASPERQAIDPDPASFLTSSEIMMMREP